MVSLPNHGTPVRRERPLGNSSSRATGHTSFLVLPMLLACATARPPPEAHTPPFEYPGTLVEPRTLPGDFMRRQRISAQWKDGGGSFEAVLQKQGNRLLLVGLAPWGSKAFVLEQNGLEVTFRSYVDRELPFPPRNLLLDIHRTYFMGIPGAPLADGEHAAERDGERVVERWAGGRLAERRFARLDGRPPGEIVVVFAQDDSAAVPRVELQNGWFGYRLSIETLSEEKL